MGDQKKKKDNLYDLWMCIGDNPDKTMKKWPHHSLELYF